MQRDLIWLLLAMIVETVHTERCTVAQLESADLPLSHTECCWLGLDSAFQPLCSCPVGYHISMSYECVFGPGESPPTPPPTIDTGVQPGEGEYHCSIDDLLGQHLDWQSCDQPAQALRSELGGSWGRGPGAHGPSGSGPWDLGPTVLAQGPFIWGHGPFNKRYMGVFCGPI